MGLSGALDEAKLALVTEMTEKIRELKKEYEGKIDDEQQNIKERHEKKMKEAEAQLREEAEEKITKVRESAEKDEDLDDQRTSYEKAVSAFEDEDEKYQAAKKKL